MLDAARLRELCHAPQERSGQRPRARPELVRRPLCHVGTFVAELPELFGGHPEPTGERLVGEVLVAVGELCERGQVAPVLGAGL